ncbi:MAG: Fpg/Nei family DNA glycosylase [Actinobacteria bacterium]|nr:Fpg/Nei family DNA glycosylase [Actinomycetota bacterium]
MPEGDTIFRAATSLRKWLVGRPVTAASSLKVPVERLVGDEVEAVEARGKHLLIRFAGGLTLHTHMRMTGAWHVYRAGEKWRKPRHLAGVVLECGDRVAVCFSAPVVELLPTRTEVLHPVLAGLGPDILSAPVDVDEVLRRAGGQPADVPIGDLLLDQQVVAGIGNIWRCEALFVCRVHPATAHPATDLAELVRTASRLMQAHARLGATYRPQIYGRSGRPCLRCRTPIESARAGRHARTAYWCPRCQPS